MFWWIIIFLEWPYAQVLNYLKATGFRVGYLFNFGSEGKLERKRLAL